MANAVRETEKPTQPLIQYAHPLDAQAYTGNDLGAVYTKSGTTFKVWAPTASHVSVKLYRTGSDEEPGAQEMTPVSMTKGDNGVWSVRLDGDKKNFYYTYLIDINGATQETADVYAKAAGVNGNRSMVVDLNDTNPDGWNQDRHVLYENPTDAVVWEVHIKDFSHSEVSGVSLRYRGKYLAFTEKGTTLGDQGEYSTCIDYLKKLGVTHVQLLPVYDYATVDESVTDSDEFNWGYDPKNYNVPEGSYSTNPFDGNVRIREFKQMIMALHEAGIGVIMDVVFNHTFTAKGGWFEMTVPGYYYRMNTDGSFSDGSGCGNETASEHLMYRKYMVDSILYWTSEYHIDGFRFDLMGVHDVDTMNEIRRALDNSIQDGKKIILYGEPWMGGPSSAAVQTAVKSNIRLLNERIGAFNDDFRDAVKGHVFNALEKGFVQDGSGRGTLKASICADSLKGGWAKQPSQSIAYVSAHDNFTLYDKLVLSVKNDLSYLERDEQLVSMNKLAAALVMTSQGINFMQAGEEFARTKQGDENSYVSPAALNELDWNRTAEYADLVSYYAGLIEIRKHFRPFRDPTVGSAEKIAFSEDAPGVVAYTLENTLTKGKEWAYAAVLFNASSDVQSVTLKEASGGQLPGEWVVIANGTEAGLNELDAIKGQTVAIAPCSAMILVDRKSFDKLSVASDACVVRVTYKDSESGEVLASRSYKGTSGSAYATEKLSSLNTMYDFDRTDGKVSGLFTKEPQQVTYYYRKYTGKLLQLTVNYYRDNPDPSKDTPLPAAEPLIRQLRAGSSYAADLRSVDGMEVDLSRFPVNAAGIAGDEDIAVSYYYITPDPVPLVLHYASDSDKDISVRVWSRDDGEMTEYTAPGGTMMKADAAMGKGWHTLTLEEIPQGEDIRAVFSDDPEREYVVSGEVWMEGGSVTGKGTVNVLYVEDGVKVLKTAVLTGRKGSVYQTREEGFDGLEKRASTANVNGVFGEKPVYVIYTYSAPAGSGSAASGKSSDKVLPVILLISGSAALLAAASLALLRRKKCG